jgi:hypothetical protein
MSNVEAALASTWLAQIGSKCVSVTGVPACAASGIPFSIRVGGTDLTKRLVSLDSVPPPPPDDVAMAPFTNAEKRDDRQATTPSTPGTIDFEARRVFFCDTFEGTLKWACPMPPASTHCEEPPPCALRFELRSLPPIGNHSPHHPRCLCVIGGIPNAKVDRNWVIAYPAHFILILHFSCVRTGQWVIC